MAATQGVRSHRLTWLYTGRLPHLHIKRPQRATEPPQQHIQTTRRAKQNPGGVYTSGVRSVSLFICRCC